MTSCLFAKAPDRIVAVADGRLSVSDEVISFDTAKKIISFTPAYRIPRIERGYFVRYSNRTIADWCIAYAGNVALASEIHRLFIDRVTKGLFLTWTDGEATLEDSFNEGAQFGDYNFENNDLIPLTPATLAGRLYRIAKTKCDEFALRRRVFPDCEFLLFGRDEETSQWSGFKVYAEDVGWSPGLTARVILEEIPDGRLTAIGSRSVAGEAYADDMLIAGLVGWKVNKSAKDMFAFLDDPIFSAPALAAPVHDPADWTLLEVRRRFEDLVQGSADPAVGGDILIATGDELGSLTLNSD
ncbi:hypothetical protein [Brevundimonas pondensis]|uniref:Uncharacterized protein n=1 Tax=Brevundimonas pondensis TaxID=2774189 RepID=A0ABX7SNR7_9CAUL|nr:hypothetical protein [Brevundimonas pondensis]QTC88445.1 hypothetical protein IFE19_03370 [Brevundimonas pondensis]